MFSVIVSPENLGTAGPFTEELEAVLDWVVSENRAGGSVKLPGSPELEMRQQRG